MHRGWLCVSAVLIALLGLGALSLSSARQRAETLDTQPKNGWHEATPDIWSGPSPDVASFRLLAASGVRTVVSVDGARPDIDAAQAAGLGYVHIPIGYDAVPHEAIASLTRMMQECPRPIYVHCHLGRHRGPAAAAICAMIDGEIDRDQARSFLSQAGTSREYDGLWNSVAAFKPLPADVTLPPLVSAANVEPLAEVMVRIDNRFEQLEQAVMAGRFDNDFHSTALLLHEDFREANRLLIDDRFGIDGELDAAVQLTAEIAHQQPATASDARYSIDRLADACSACHRAHRD